MRILITSIVDLKRVPHNRIHVFADYLSRRHDVTALCLNAWWLARGDADDGGGEHSGDPYFRELFERARVHYLSERRDPPVLQEVTCLPRLNGVLRNIDLSRFDVHLNYGNLVAGYFVSRKAKPLGIPTVLDLADDLPQSFARSPQVPPALRPVAWLVARAMLKANVRLASRVTFVTKALKDAYLLPDSKAALIPNGYHADLCAQSSNDSLREELGLGDAFVVGFVGNLLEWVDLDPAFSALRTLASDGKDLRMLIVGGGEKLDQSVALAKAYGISDTVVFTNHVALARVPEYISCMDVCLVSRKPTTDSDRSLPVKLFEYMACQKPVISVPLVGVREAVGDRVLYASDSSELVDRIERLYTDRILREELGSAGKAFVEQNYDWEHICARFEATLAEATKEYSASNSALGLAE
ncbi:MAG: glycosyltransferase [Anaerolineae bacterium]|nr:glycosyltransferase [Anaerolineae bacterium]NIN96886.1 glycosyltransferase [Anaerolineae bacterium]NIQ82740.1 glycosyltransferase [Anaerolineae bacterium]